jgi:NDP-mannose synthase
MVKTFFEHHRALPKKVRLRYVEEEEPTGTAGSLALVPGLTDTFLVANGDLLTNLSIRNLVHYHREQGALLTIATHERKVKIDLGVMEVDDAGRVRDYREKPESSYLVSMGIYVYEPSVLNYVTPGEYLDFPDLVLKLLAKGEKVCSYLSDCLWLDIGRPDDYAKAQELFAERSEDFDLV